MSLALIGIVWLQVFQIRKAIKLNEENFNISVNDALNHFVDRLYSEEIQTNFIRVSRAMNVDLVDSGDSTSPLFTRSEQNGGFVLKMDGDADFGGNRPRTRITIRDSVNIITEQETYITGDSLFLGNDAFTYVSYDGTNSSFKDLKLEMRGPKKIVEMMSQTLNGLSSFNMKIPERIDSIQVDTMLRQALHDQGIYQPYHFMIKEEESNQAFFKTGGLSEKSFISSRHTIRLFPYQRLGSQSSLYVVFPDKNFNAFRGVWVQAIASIFFTLIILICFGLTIRILLRQKKLSEMKNDFINNMTHELKTPIATISLAADAMNNPRIRSDINAIERYTGIIKEENTRMHRQVERVLQAARFDRKEIQLKQEKVDIHQLIQKATQNVLLQVHKREGELNLYLDAKNYELEVDKVHITNVIYNLLDNADKYSPEAPVISVSTENLGNRLIIRVSDQGMGISKADQQQIFARFYRVSTGNLHDVKGFGLGLSYVKEIVEAHQGSVSVSSIPGKGSTFEIIFPLADK
ncbi:MAG: HAMP domain-containing sensor histidine kinase [Bacteroidia bacterium]